MIRKGIVYLLIFIGIANYAFGGSNFTFPVGGGSGGGSVSVTGTPVIVEVDDSIVVTNAGVLDFLGADFTVTESPANEANISITFIGTPTATSGNILVSDGTDFEGVAMSGDATIASGGAVTVVDDSHAHVIANIDSMTKSALEGQVSDVSDFAEADGDVFTGVHDFGGADSIEIVNGAAPTTDATGEIALDTTITDHQPLLQYFDGGENMTVIAIDTAELPATDNEIVKYDAATDKFVLEADSGGSGGSGTVTNVIDTFTAEQFNLLNDQIPTLALDSNDEYAFNVLQFDNLQSAGTQWAGPQHLRCPSTTCTNLIFITQGYANNHPSGATNAALYRYTIDGNAWTVVTGSTYAVTATKETYSGINHVDEFQITAPDQYDSIVWQYANAPTGTVSGMSLTSSWNTVTVSAGWILTD